MITIKRTLFLTITVIFVPLVAMRPDRLPVHREPHKAQKEKVLYHTRNLRNAIRDNNNDKIKRALEQGADINYKNRLKSQPHTPLQLAILAQDITILSTLIEYCNNNIILNTALITACKFNRLDKVAFLIQKGANVNYMQDYSFTALTHAAKHDSRVEVAKILLDNGARIDIQDLGGRTALMIAAAYGGKNIIELLLHYGASPYLLDSRDRTALAWSQEHNNGITRNILQAHIAMLESWNIYKQYLNIEAITSNEDKLALLDKAISCHDTEVITRLLATGYIPPIAILQKTMATKSKKILREYFEVLRLLVLLNKTPETESTLAGMPSELILYLMGSIMLEKNAEIMVAK